MIYTISVPLTDALKMNQIAVKKSCEERTIWADAISALVVGLQYKHEGEELIWLKNYEEEEHPFFAHFDKDVQTKEVKISFSNEVNQIIVEMAELEVVTPEMLLAMAIATYLHGWELKERFSLWVRTPPNASALREVRLPSFS